MATRRFGPCTFETSNEDKVLFPKAGITKGDLMDYYQQIADTMLPHLRHRPIVMQRFPDGIQANGFYHKDAPDHFPDWIQTVRVKKQEGGSLRHVICRNTATLVYLANQGCITPHAWLSQTPKLNQPSQVIFDLDPASNDFGSVKKAALRLHDLLNELGLPSFVKTSGSRGLHIMIPLAPNHNFKIARSFARWIGELLVDRHPKSLTMEPRKNKRQGRLYVDTARNAYAQTVAPPYAVRPRPEAPVSAPLDWDEVKDSRLRASSYTVRNIRQRLGQKEDPWRNWNKAAVSPRKVMERQKSD